MGDFKSLIFGLAAAPQQPSSDWFRVGLYICMAFSFMPTLLLILWRCIRGFSLWLTVSGRRKGVEGVDWKLEETLHARMDAYNKRLAARALLDWKL